MGATVGEGAWLAYAFFACVGVITVGLLWFRVVRPALEDFGLLAPAEDDAPTVNHSAQPTANYVAEHGGFTPRSAPFRQEREPEREPERPGTAEEATPAAPGKVYTPEQIRTLEDAAEERGRAEALGKLLGRQLVDPADRGVAMELLFGPRGRRHQRVRPLVDAAAASVAPPTAEARLVPVNDGERGHVEL